MTLEDMQDVLRRLAALADGWETAGQVPPIERDLALDKLRLLYEALLIGTAKPEAPVGSEAAAETVPDVGISLDEVLAIEPVSESVEPEVYAEAALESAKTEEVRIVASVPVPEVPAEAEPVAPVSAGKAAPSAARVAASEQEAEPAEVPVSRAGERTQTPSQPVFPTLFGLEETEEVRRRRHKQQVLMSLYDDEPRPARWFAVASEPVAGESVAAGAGSPLPPAEARTSDGGGLRGDREVSEPVGFSEENVPGKEGAACGAARVNIVIGDVDLPSGVPSAAGDHAGKKGSATGSARAASGGSGHAPAPGTAGNTVLGEVINHDMQRLADTLAAPRDRASETARPEPVADLREAIGLNDKFLLIRDLFGGDSAVYDRAIEALNACADLDDCMIYIAEHYAWNPHSDGSKRVMELLERKFA